MMHRGSFHILRSFSARHFQLDVDEAILVGCCSNPITLLSKHLVMMRVGKSLKASQAKGVLVSWLTLLHVPAKCGIKPSATTFPGQVTWAAACPSTQASSSRPSPWTSSASAGSSEPQPHQLRLHHFLDVTTVVENLVLGPTCCKFFCAEHHLMNIIHYFQCTKII